MSDCSSSMVLVSHLIMQLCCLESTRNSASKCIDNAQVQVDSFTFFLLCWLCKAKRSEKQQLVFADK